MLSKNFLSDKIELLFAQFVKVNGSLRPPIDPAALAPLCGVVSIEHRQMVPEGVLSPVPGGFTIFLQSNFTSQPGVKLRQRFTIAHELAHTFYYDLNGGIPRRRKDSPKGQTLERLCHIGASQILMPEEILRRELKTKGEVASTESVLDLSKVFDVSTEASIRRLHALEIIAGDKFAAILVGSDDGGKRLIQAACYGPLLLCYAGQPKRGLDFDSWVRPILGSSVGPSDTEWTHKTALGTVTAKKVFRSRRSFILDLRFGSPTFDNI